MDNDKKYFIINKMYAGDYLNIGQNIGHEVINLLCADDGNNYIYINPSGTIDGKYDKENIEAAFLTKQHSKGCQEILGIAEVEDQLLKQSEGDIEEQASKLKMEYGGHPLKSIFKNNLYYSEAEDDNSKRKKDRSRIKKDEVANKATFLTKKDGFYKPASRIILADKNADEYELESLEEEGCIVCRLGDYEFGHQSPKLYFSNQDDDAKRGAYNKLEEIFISAKNEKNFKKEMPKKVDAEENAKKRAQYRKQAVSYLEAMSQLDRENIFSNLICFFLDFDRNLLQKFCKSIFGVDINENAEIKREHHHTDIWIQDDKNIIVIENKIHSGLNGKDGGQLEEYEVAAEKEAAEKNIAKTNIKYFIIAPDYYNKIPKEKLKVENGEYKMIRYSVIYDIFNKGYSLKQGPDMDDEYYSKIVLYYEDFKRALLAHAQKSDMTKQEAMERRFYARLDQLDRKRSDKC